MESCKFSAGRKSLSHVLLCSCNQQFFVVVNNQKVEVAGCKRGTHNSNVFQQWGGFPPVSFSAVIDSSLGKHSFLPNYPWHLSPNKVPVIIGINTHDGSITVTQLCKDQLKLAKELEAELAYKLPLATNIQDHVANNDKKKVSQSLMRFYLKEKNITKETIGVEFSHVSLMDMIILQHSTTVDLVQNYLLWRGQF